MALSVAACPIDLYDPGESLIDVVRSSMFGLIKVLAAMVLTTRSHFTDDDDDKAAAAATVSVIQALGVQDLSPETPTTLPMITVLTIFDNNPLSCHHRNVTERSMIVNFGYAHYPPDVASGTTQHASLLVSMRPGGVYHPSYLHFAASAFISAATSSPPVILMLETGVSHLEHDLDGSLTEGTCNDDERTRSKSNQPFFKTKKQDRFATKKYLAEWAISLYHFHKNECSLSGQREASKADNSTIYCEKITTSKLLFANVLPNEDFLVSRLADDAVKDADASFEKMQVCQTKALREKNFNVLQALLRPDCIQIRDIGEPDFFDPRASWFKAMSRG
eukprot:jgi/Bigna1/68588/fgenesh1_pg.6_\